MKEFGLSPEEIDRLPADEVEAYLIIINYNAKEREKERKRMEMRFKRNG